MNTTEAGLLGIQSTLVGLVFVTFFEGVDPYPLVGFLLCLVGTAVVLVSVFSGRGLVVARSQ